MKTKSVYRGLLAIFFVAAGAGHFVTTATYLKIMPPYIPAPLAMVYLSGISEILLGLLVIQSPTRKLAGWGLIALLVAVFPANLHLALHPEIFPNIPAWMDWARLPLQGLFIFWVYQATLGIDECT